jgi:hypothetical protein
MTLRRWPALVALLWGCAGADDPQGFVNLGIDVENAAGGRVRVTCEPLPFLNGSRRLTEHVVDDAFSITVMTSPHEARLTFTEGQSELGDALVVSRGALENDYDEEFALTLDDGSLYSVSVSSGCEP